MVLFDVAFDIRNQVQYDLDLFENLLKQDCIGTLPLSLMRRRSIIAFVLECRGPAGVAEKSKTQKSRSDFFSRGFALDPQSTSVILTCLLPARTKLGVRVEGKSHLDQSTPLVPH